MEINILGVYVIGDVNLGLVIIVEVIVDVIKVVNNICFVYNYYYEKDNLNSDVVFVRNKWGIFVIDEMFCS